jgi:hypothetical protein
VVAQLLNGSPFNYVILSSPSEPRGIARLILSSARSAHESTNSEAPVLPKNDVAATQLYGAAFGADADAPAEVLPTEKTAAIVGANPSADWAQHDGPRLSGEDLDRMQKMQIEQEQQQFAQQLQQQRQKQQQEQPSQNSTPQ